MEIHVPDIRDIKNCRITIEEVMKCIETYHDVFLETTTLQRNWVWIVDNLHIYESFSDLTKYYADITGAKHLSPDLIVNVLRFFTHIRDRNTNAKFKINSRSTCFLSRLFTCMNPEYDGIFQRNVTNPDHEDYKGKPAKSGHVPSGD